MNHGNLPGPQDLGQMDFLQELQRDHPLVAERNRPFAAVLMEAELHQLVELVPMAVPYRKIVVD